MHDLAHDLRSSWRALLRRPVATAVTLGTLALGLTASVAVFTYLNGFYQTFPGVDARGLMQVFAVDDDAPYQDISYLDFLDYAAADGAFEGLAAAQADYAASVRHEDFTEVAFLEAVSGSYFDVLDVDVQLGRGLAPPDDRPGAPAVAVLSHAWWQSSFAGNEAVIGSTIYLNYLPYTVVGVAGADFLGSTAAVRPHVWIPFAPFRTRYTNWDAAAEDRDQPLVRVYGRLRPGAGRQRGLEELSAVAAGLDEAYPRAENERRRLRVEQATWIDPRARLAEMPTVRVMMAAALGLLLLVCANVANLLLAIAAGRQREIATRAALGAPPARLLRQALVENVLLSLTGGTIALLLAGPAAARLGSYFARPSVWGANVSRQAAIDWRVAGFALLVSLATGLLAGVLPAWRATRRDLLSTLRSDSAGALGGSGRLGRGLPGLQDVLVIAQVALSVVLVVVAGLVLRTLDAVDSIDPGFDYQRMVASYVSSSSTSVEVEGREQWFRDLSERLAEEPWVRGAAIADAALLSPHSRAGLLIDGAGEVQRLMISRVNAGFFATVGIEVVAGRPFELTDGADAPGVAIVSQELARRYFDGSSALGRRLVMPGRGDAPERSFEIIGVARDAKVNSFIDEIEPVAYFSYPQFGYPSGSALMVATTGDPAAAVPRLTTWLRAFEPHIAIVNVLPYTDVIRGFTYVQRMNAELFSVLAFLALALAAVGIFSVMSLAVSRRQREIGIRMAIGAQRGDIGKLVLGRAFGPVAIGLLFGLAGSFAATRLVQSLLLGVAPGDPLTLAGGTAVLVLAALAATWWPARRAATVDPVIALRRD